MNRNATTRRLGAALGLAAFCFAATAGTAPAQAKSGAIDYQCSIVPLHGDQPLSDSHPMTATFDSAMENGTTVPLGSRVEIAPVGGSLTLSPALVDELLAYADGKMAKGKLSWVMTGYLGNARLKTDISWRGQSYALEAGKTVTAKGTGAPADGSKGSFEASLEGPYDFLADEVFAQLNNGEDLSAFLKCRPERDAKTHIDTVTAVAAASNTTPPRPSVVQTDAAQPTKDAGMPSALVAGSAFLALVGAMGARRLATRR